MLKKTFRPHFSDAARVKDRAEKLHEALQAERLTHAATQRKLARCEEENRDLLKKLLEVEFQPRVAKGCYTHCPIGRLK